MSCQSIELSLKAYLSLRGASRAALKSKPYGHNLARLFRDARDKGIGVLVALVSSDADAISNAADWYHTHRRKRFQYFEVMDAITGFKNAPELAPLEDLATRLQAPSLRDMVLRES